jgi:hypothetical protein
LQVDRPLGRRVPTRLGELWFDKLTEADLDAVAGYFLRPDPHLDAIMDRSKLPGQAALRAYYDTARYSGDPGQMAAAFGLRLDSRLVGFTILMRKTPEENYSHWHIIDPKDRAGGVSSAIYPTRIELYFDLFPIGRLIHQTRSTNTGVNRMLDRFVPVAKTEFVENPDGLARPGDFHIRYVTRADIPRIREIGRRFSGRAS